MTPQPTSIDELRQVIVAEPRVRVRGGGTKPGLSAPHGNEAVIELSALSGIVEHTPEECTFTALAGTPVVEIERRLTTHGQYLPFDPPFAAAGATIGGTAAAGINGSCRYRYGGIRDFLIGARIVDGRGRLITSGGKVVKNAAGFLLHQAMVGSAGRLGIFAELTFKVFPRAEAYATIRAEAADLEAALGTLASVRGGRFDLEAADIEAPSTLWLRLGGFVEALASRIAALQRSIGVPSVALEGDADTALWQRAREFAWVSPGAALVRVPIAPSRLASLDAALGPANAPRRYAVGGNVAFVAWPGAVDDLSRDLEALGLVGQVLIGPPGRPFIGAVKPSEFERRVEAVMDPDGRFATGR
jgi:glycolate dehydrogenase FAD-binding subunit